MAIGKRKIPKKDKEKRSLYMSAQTIKNLPKKKRIEWEGDKTPSGSGESYTYAQSGKAVMGKKKKAIRTKYGDDVDVDIDKHMSFPDKKGGSENYRRKVRGKYRQVGGSKNTDSTVETTYTKQTRGGKVLKKENIPESEESMKKIMKDVQEEVERPKKKKTVKQKTTTYQGKKGDTIKPKVKKKKYFTNNQTGKKEQAPPPGLRPEKKKPQYDFVPSKKDYENFEKRAKKRKEAAKKENDDRVQKQIKSGFGDMLTPSSMRANSEATKKRMKASSDATIAKMKADREKTLKRMKANK